MMIKNLYYYVAVKAETLICFINTAVKTDNSLRFGLGVLGVFS